MPRRSSAPFAGSRPIEILNVKEGTEWTVVFLAGFQGHLMHWKGSRSLPCFGLGVCDSTLHKGLQTWSGYAPGLAFEQVSGKWWGFLLQLTASFAREIEGRQLRGEIYQLARPTTGQKYPPMIGCALGKWEQPDLPTPFDIEPVLKYAWGVDRLALGAANPLPRRALGEGVDAPLPSLLLEANRAKEQPATKEQFAEFRRMMNGVSFSTAERESNGQRPAEKRPAERNGSH